MEIFVTLTSQSVVSVGFLTRTIFLRRLGSLL